MKKLNHFQNINKKEGMNKKGVVPIFLVIFGIIIFIILFVAACSGVDNYVKYISKITGSSKDTQGSTEQLVEEFQKVSEMTEKSGKLVSLTRSKESAIIGFDAKSDFFYFHGISKNSLNSRSYLKGTYMKRPAQCEENSACICACGGFDLEPRKIGTEEFDDQQISCYSLECKTLENVQIPRKSYMNGVFDDDMLRENADFFKRDKYYWYSSFIILRSEKINPYETTTVIVGPSFVNAPIVVAGFRDFYTLNRVDVYLKKISSNAGKSVIGICFKENIEDCLTFYPENAEAASEDPEGTASNWAPGGGETGGAGTAGSW